LQSNHEYPCNFAHFAHFADLVDKAVASRLGEQFAMKAADGTSFDRQLFLNDAKADYAKCSTFHELFWVDCFHSVREGSAWRVKYHLCRMGVGKERKEDSMYYAIIQSSEGAPEKCVIESINAV
jgi:hypothetical protein